MLGLGADLDEAVSVAWQAVFSTPADNHERVRRLSSLGNALRAKGGT